MSKFLHSARNSIRCTRRYCKKKSTFDLRAESDAIVEEASANDHLYKIGYLKIPVLAKYYVVGEAGNGLGLFLGPHVGLGIFTKVVHGKLKENSSLEKKSLRMEILKKMTLRDENEDGDEVDIINALDMGLIVGANYEFDFGLSVGLRYDLGLLGAFNTAALYQEDNTLQKQCY